jgi:hypothetical protein
MEWSWCYVKDIKKKNISFYQNFDCVTYELKNLLTKGDLFSESALFDIGL